MMKLLRKHQKKLLAVFTAGLMIVFVADIGITRYRASTMEDAQGRVVGEAGEFKVRSTDLRNAKSELEFLASTVVIPTGSQRPGEQFVPVLYRLLPQQTVKQLIDRPEVYVLLLEEARRIPVYYSNNDLEQFMNGVGIRQQDRVVELSAAPNLRGPVRQALANLLMVWSAFERASDSVKISQPFVQHQVVQNAQRLTLDYVTVDAKPILERAEPPAEDQLQAHFAKYADVAPGTRTPANPLGFGYRVPPQVKLQYIAVPREQLRKVVESRKDQYTWELEAQRYYQERQREFAAPPATRPATQPATQPAVRPFDEVRGEILERLMNPEITKLNEQVRKHIETTMRADYEAWARVHAPTTGPSTGPSTGPATAPAALATAPGPATAPAVASSLGVPYDSFEYLQKLADAVQQKFGVLPAVHSIAEPQSREQLAKIDGIGAFAQDVFFMSWAFVPQAMRNDPAALREWEPSEPRAGEDQTLFVYRVTHAERAHPPRQLDDVRAQLVEDARQQWAWDQAKAEAQSILEQARAAGELKSAAGQRPLATAGPVTRASTTIPGIEFGDPQSRAAFVFEAFDMSSRAGTQPSNRPLRAIELPREMRVLVAQLANVETQLSPDDLYMMRTQGPLVMRRQLQSQLIGGWFHPDSVAQRMNYIDHDAATPQSSAAAP